MKPYNLVNFDFEIFHADYTELRLNKIIVTSFCKIQAKFNDKH